MSSLRILKERKIMMNDDDDDIYVQYIYILIQKMSLSYYSYNNQISGLADFLMKSQDFFSYNK